MPNFLLIRLWFRDQLLRFAATQFPGIKQSEFSTKLVSSEVVLPK